MNENIFDKLDFGPLRPLLDNDDITDISFDNNGRWHDCSFILAITSSPNSCIVAIIVSVVLL